MHREHKEQQEHREHKEFKEQQEHREHKELPVRRDFEATVIPVYKEQRVVLDLRDFKELVHREHKVIMDHRELQEHRVQPEEQVHRVLKVLVLKVQPEEQVQPGEQVHRARKGQVVVYKELLDRLVLKVLLVQVEVFRVHRVLREYRV